jgi:hypothetical protein
VIKHKANGLAAADIPWRRHEGAAAQQRHSKAEALAKHGQLFWLLWGRSLRVVRTVSTALSLATLYEVCGHFVGSVDLHM